MSTIFAENIAYDQENCLDRISLMLEEAKREFMEAVFPESYFLEAMDPNAMVQQPAQPVQQAVPTPQVPQQQPVQQSGGLFQAIGRLLSAIINAISDGLKKIGQWVTGVKVSPEGKTASIEGQQPEAVVQAMNAELAQSSSLLQRACMGQTQPGEVDQYVQKAESAWTAMKKSMIPVVGIAAFFAAKYATIDKWTAEARAMKQQIESDDGESPAMRIAKTLPADKKAAAQQEAMTIISTTDRHIKGALGLIMNPFKECIQKKYLVKDLTQEADNMLTKDGRIKNKQKRKATRDATNAYTKILNRETRNINKGNAEAERQIGKQKRADNAQKKAERKRYIGID